MLTAINYNNIDNNASNYGCAGGAESHPAVFIWHHSSRASLAERFSLLSSVSTLISWICQTHFHLLLQVFHTSLHSHFKWRLHVSLSLYITYIHYNVQFDYDYYYYTIYNLLSIIATNIIIIIITITNTRLIIILNYYEYQYNHTFSILLCYYYYYYHNYISCPVSYFISLFCSYLVLLLLYSLFTLLFFPTSDKSFVSFPSGTSKRD